MSQKFDEINKQFSELKVYQEKEASNKPKSKAKAKACTHCSGDHPTEACHRPAVAQAENCNYFGGYGYKPNSALGYGDPNNAANPQHQNNANQNQKQYQGQGQKQYRSDNNNNNFQSKNFQQQNQQHNQGYQQNYQQQYQVPTPQNQNNQVFFTTDERLSKLEM